MQKYIQGAYWLLTIALLHLKMTTKENPAVKNFIEEESLTICGNLLTITSRELEKKNFRLLSIKNLSCKW
uniref:Uncharacterized protein n=1 Tax=Rhizophora mucronata TaxID=61149 RepID=A0A2P2LSN8_RHIMU